VSAPLVGRCQGPSLRNSLPTTTPTIARASLSAAPVAATAPSVMALILLSFALLPFSFASLSAASPATIASLFRCSTPDSTCAALGELYSTTGGPHWQRQRGWAEAARPLSSRQDDREAWPSYCGFEGVSCDARGAVTRLCVPHSPLIAFHALTRCFSPANWRATDWLAASLSR